MAHMLYGNDTMFSAGMQKPWHYNETQDRCRLVQEAPTSWDALKLSGLDWDVAALPVEVGGQIVPGYQANVRMDTGETLGITSKLYKIVQNREAFAFTDAVLRNRNDVRYETAGSLENGRRVWLLARMPDSKLIEDTVENYLFFSNSHNGKSSIVCGITQVRIVCNNTLQMALASPRTWSTQHKGDMQSKQMEAVRTLALASDYIDKSSQLAIDMASKPLTNVLSFIDKLLPKLEDLSAREERNIDYIRDNILDIYKNKDDLQNFRGTTWGMYNAVADFVSNGKPLRMTKTYGEKRFASFMDGNEMLLKAQTLLQTA